MAKPLSDGLPARSPNLAEARGAVERIIRDSHRASEVIKRLRELARKSDPQMAALDINDVIADVVALVQREVLSHRVRLRLDLDNDVEAGDRRPGAAATGVDQSHDERHRSHGHRQ